MSISFHADQSSWLLSKPFCTFSLQWTIPLCWNFPRNFISTFFGQKMKNLPTSTFQAMNPGLRSTTYDVNDLFSTSDQKRNRKRQNTKLTFRTLLQSTDIYIMINTYVHIYIYLYNYTGIYTYICCLMCILYSFGCSPQIYCTYLMFGWYFHVYLQCQRHIL